MTSSATGASAPLSFSFDQSFDVRVVMIDGDPWFVAADVCAALNLSNPSMAVAGLDDDEKRVSSDPQLNLGSAGSGAQSLILVNESGLYTLILRCRNATKPGTVPHRFRKWVTSEVLPSIRKTGSYQIPNPEIPQAMETVNSADLAKLSQIVYLLKTNFHMEGSASHAAYARLRKEFGLEKGISSLPTLYLDQAIEILSEMNRLAFAFKGIVIEAEAKFFRQVMRSGKTMGEAEFDAFFASELQQMIDNHRDSLKLLN